MRSSNCLNFPSAGPATLTVTGGHTDSIAATVLVAAVHGAGGAWSAAFTASYVAQLANKAGGSAVSFADFVAGIRAAAAAGDGGAAELSDGISWQLDLLTMQQLLQLRAAKTGAATSIDAAAAAPQTERRFLIVTRTRGANRVHFPLPLDPVATGDAADREAQPDVEPDVSSRGVSRLRRLRTRLSQLRRENRRLVKENRRLAAEADEAASLQREAAELGAAARRARASLDQQRRQESSASAELAGLRAEVAALRAAEREARRRLAEAEAALAAQRAGLRLSSMRRHARFQDRSNPAEQTAPAPPRRQADPPQTPLKPSFSPAAKRAGGGPPSPMPYEADIADIDRRLEELRCALDQALVLPARG